MNNNLNMLFAIITTTLIPFWTIFAIIFHIKIKSNASFIFSLGFILLLIGSLFQFMFPFSSVKLNEAGQVISKSGPNYIWYFGISFSLISLILITIGFAWYVFKLKKHLTKSIEQMG